MSKARAINLASLIAVNEALCRAMRVFIQSRSGKDLIPGGIEITDKAAVEDLQRAVHKKKAKLYPARQRFSLPLPPNQKLKPTALTAGSLLEDYGITDGSVIVLKDLGPQVGYSTVFFWEYFGPLAVYALIYFFPDIFYRHHKRTQDKTLVQQMAVLYWSFHYIKRISETFLVHRFSHSTMPIRNLFKNCSYYWGFAAYVSYFVNHPLYTEPPHQVAVVLFLLAMAFQSCNLKSHLILANLRPPGKTSGYSIPRGFLFDYITCPNYTTEILGWLCFTFATRCFAALLFTVAGAFQMLQWAIAKHTRLRKTFDGKDGREKYPRRWVMLPPLI